MELIHEPRMARKVTLLQDSQLEVLVLTSPSLLETWSPSLTEALALCAGRGLKVRVLVEAASPRPSARLTLLQNSGAEVRLAGKIFPWSFRAMPVQGEMWIFDRTDVMAVNERRALPRQGLTMAVECLMGPDVATGAATYFDMRWQSSKAVIFSVRHKNYAFHSGREGPKEFFGCLISAKKEILIALPGSRVSKRVEEALHTALAGGIQVTAYVNAEREDAPALKRLRRLAAAGAVLKICGNRLTSECALVDGTSAYMGSLPTSWNPLVRKHPHVFLVQNRAICEEIFTALESQVSVEITAKPASSYPLAP